MTAEVIPIAEGKSQQFTLELDGKKAVASGALLDTTDLSQWQDILSDGTQIDFGRVTFVSWVGLRTFLDWIESQDIWVTVEDFGLVEYRFYLLMAPDYPHTKVTSMCVWVFDNHHRLTTKRISEDDIIGITDPTKPGMAISEKYNLMSPAMFLMADTPYELISPGKWDWAKEHHLEIDFWQRYCGFIADTCQAVNYLILSSEFDLLAQMKTLTEDFRKIESILAKINPAATRDIIPIANSARDAIEKEYSKLESTYWHHFQDQIKKQLPVALASYDEKHYKDYLNKIGLYIRTISALKKFGGMCEKTGQIISDHVYSVNLSEYYLASLQGQADIGPQDVEAIRAAFDVYEQPQKDWPATRQQIAAKSTKHHDRIMAPTLILQNFDLIKQIIDHRIEEAEAIEDILAQLNRGSVRFDSLATEICQKIKDNSVTDIEDSAFRFYFPSLHSAGDLKINPGKTMVF